MTASSPNFNALSELVLQWARDRQIIPNSHAITLAIKTMEELTELQSAILHRKPDAMADAYGDILVTLIIGAELAGFDLTQCLHDAYLTIKHRTGTFTPAGIFVKD